MNHAILVRYFFERITKHINFQCKHKKTKKEVILQEPEKPLALKKFTSPNSKSKYKKDISNLFN